MVVIVYMESSSASDAVEQRRFSQLAISGTQRTTDPPSARHSRGGAALWSVTFGISVQPVRRSD